MKPIILTFISILTLTAADVDSLNLRARTSLKQARATDSSAVNHDQLQEATA